MRIIAHEMPDMSVVRSTLFEPMLAWLKAGRTLKDIECFVVEQVAAGATESDARILLSAMNNTDREIENRVKDSRFSVALATEWANAIKIGGLTDTQALDLIARVSMPNAIRHVEVLDIVTKETAEYRFDPNGKSTLRLSGNILTWHMPGVRDKERELRRRARTPRLAALDIDYMRADERGDEVEKLRIAAKKQYLRDITDDPAIEAAQTPDELISVGVMLIEVQP